MPVGISSTARLTAAKSINSGISSSLYTGMGLLASIARARNDSLLILAYLRRRMNASAFKRWQKQPKCLSNAHISFHRHIFDDALPGYLPRDENYLLGLSSDERFPATCNVSFSSIMADRVTINISQRAVRCASCRLRPRRRVNRLWRIASHSIFVPHFSRVLLNDDNLQLSLFLAPRRAVHIRPAATIFVIILAANSVFIRIFILTAQ